MAMTPAVVGADVLQHTPPPRRVQPRRGLVQDQYRRLHGDDPRDGDALFLPAGEEVRRVGDEFIHAHGPQCRVHPAADFLRGHPQVLRGEGHILFHHVGNDLVVRILEHHTHPLADGQKKLLVQGVHALYPDLPPRRE